MRLESVIQRQFINQLSDMFPRAILFKTDSGYINSFPDIGILLGNVWAMFEIKRSRDAEQQPNQEYYVDLLDDLSFSRFVYPDNINGVLFEFRSWLMAHHPEVL